MCLNPPWVALPRDDGMIQVPCQLCWQCRSRRVGDYIGRGLCEIAYSQSACALTLTYADSLDLSHEIVNPSHFQKFIRSLRDRGTTVRYIATAEFGKLRGRVHFHAVLFFGQNPPQWAHLDRDWDAAWPHGHIYADWNVDHKSLQYPLKYIQKDNAWFTVSKKPALGGLFFAEKAKALFTAGLVPRSFRYLPPSGSKDKRYYLSGASRRDFLLALNDLYDGAGMAVPDMVPEVHEAMQKALRWRSDLGLAKWSDARVDLMWQAGYRLQAQARRAAQRDLARHQRLVMMQSEDF